jgi:hypothetical protein
VAKSTWAQTMEERKVDCAYHQDLAADIILRKWKI